MRPLFVSLAVAGLFALTYGAARADSSLLYSGALGTAPGAQGWSSSLTGATETLGAGWVGLDTTASNRVAAGYGRTNPFALDRTTGYDVRFDLQIVSENHDGSDKNGDGIPDRAGFSVIVLGSDKKGVELGFWNNQIWPQLDNPLFTHPASGSGEMANFDTTQSGQGAAGLIAYDLHVVGSQYSLYANNSPTALLTGSLRDYSGATGLAGLVYNQKNFLFFGDDTTSARGDARLSRVFVQSVPEAQTWLTFGVLLTAGHLALRRRRRGTMPNLRN